MRRLIPAAALCLLAAACTQDAADPVADRVTMEPYPAKLARCGAADLAPAIGDVLVKGPAGPGQVSEAALPFPHRIMVPGEAYTMEYRPERLIVEVDETNMITGLRCG